MMRGDPSAMKGEGVLVEAFSDADGFAANKINRKSVSGGVLMVGGMIVGWLCKKQKCVALSTMEADLVAASQTAAELVGILELLEAIGALIQTGSLLHVDNQAEIAQIKREDTSGRANILTCGTSLLRTSRKRR